MMIFITALFGLAHSATAEEWEDIMVGFMNTDSTFISTKQVISEVPEQDWRAFLLVVKRMDAFMLEELSEKLPKHDRNWIRRVEAITSCAQATYANTLKQNDLALLHFRKCRALDHVLTNEMNSDDFIAYLSENEATWTRHNDLLSVQKVDDIFNRYEEELWRASKQAEAFALYSADLWERTFRGRMELNDLTDTSIAADLEQEPMLQNTKWIGHLNAIYDMETDYERYTSLVMLRTLFEQHLGEEWQQLSEQYSEDQAINQYALTAARGYCTLATVAQTTGYIDMTHYFYFLCQDYFNALETTSGVIDAVNETSQKYNPKWARLVEFLVEEDVFAATRPHQGLLEQINQDMVVYARTNSIVF